MTITMKHAALALVLLVSCHLVSGSTDYVVDEGTDGPTDYQPPFLGFEGASSDCEVCIDEAVDSDVGRQRQLV